MNPCGSSRSRVSDEERKIIERHCKEVCLRYSPPALFGNWYENQFESQVSISSIIEYTVKRLMQFVIL